MVTLGFHPQTQKLKHLVQHNKRYQRNNRSLALASFRLIGRRGEFHPHTVWCIQVFSAATLSDSLGL